MEVAALGGAGLVLGMAYLSGLSALRLQGYTQELLQVRSQILKDPYKFWQRHCGGSEAELANKHILLGASLSVTLSCKQRIYWRSEGQWLPLCQVTAKHPVFSPRYYRGRVSCQLVYGQHAISLAQARWQVFR